MYRMEKTRWLAALAALLFACFAFAPAAAGAEERGSENPNVLRLHVIANSDSAQDQRVKLLVRDAVLETLPAGRSAAEARAYLLENGAEILENAERVLKENGFSYGAQLMLGRFDFPDKTYGDAFFPAGEYEALRVILGDGIGQNWWCVLFPPLCIVTKDGATASSQEDVTFESSLLRFFRTWGTGK